MAMDYPEPLPPVHCPRCLRPGYDLGGGFGPKPGTACDAPIDPECGQYCLGLFVAGSAPSTSAEK